ncbi:BRCT domain-containing protein [Magnetococcales bacterium HHB-1]
MKAHEYFQRFSWCIPRAFSDALSICFFSEGDRIYESPEAYQAWSSETPSNVKMVQVTYPPRLLSPQNKGETEQNKADVWMTFQRNWKSLLEFDLYNISGNSLEKIRSVETTQGRFLLFLETGKSEYLNDTNPHPACPVSLQEVKRLLVHEDSKWSDIIRKECPPHIIFAIPFDPTTTFYQKKHRLITESMQQHKIKPLYTDIFLDDFPRQSNLRIKTGKRKGAQITSGPFMTTHCIRCYSFPEEITEHKVKSVIKKAVYRPAKKKAPSANRFRLTTHGKILIPPTQTRSSIPLDDDDQPISLTFNRARTEDRDTSEMIGICRGLLLASKTPEARLSFLTQWLVDRRFSIGDIVELALARIEPLFADDWNASSEQRLNALLNDICGGLEPVRGASSMSTKLPITDPPPKVEFENRSFCLTGKFEYGSRRECAHEVRDRGGITTSGPGIQTHYLVVGKIGSRDWRHSSYGRKIERALEINQEGIYNIQIITEDHWKASL